MQAPGGREAANHTWLRTLHATIMARLTRLVHCRSNQPLSGWVSLLPVTVLGPKPMAKQVRGTKREHTSIALVNEHSTKLTSMTPCHYRGSLEPQLLFAVDEEDYHRVPPWTECRCCRMLSPNGTDIPYAFLLRLKHH